MIIDNNTNLRNLAQTITVNSEIFGDEVDEVVRQLAEVLGDANAYGCEFTRNIETMWGDTVEVIARPIITCHEWSF